MSVLTAEARPRGMQRYQLDPGVGRLTPAESAARGKTARWQRAGAGLDGRVAAVASGRITSEPDL